MKSIILCEGSTDYQLLQYFMRKANGWSDGNSVCVISNQKAREFVKDDKKLVIAACGGCSSLVSVGLNDILFINKYADSTNDEFYDNIVIVTDHDDENVGSNLESEIKNSFSENAVIFDDVTVNHWSDCNISTFDGEKKIKLLPLVIPFKEEGAMETFLLNSYKNQNPEEAFIVEDSVDFAKKIFDEIKRNDSLQAYPQGRKIETGRRYLTKAKFDVFFSIRTPTEQFNQRQEILKNIPWEQYESVQVAFKELAKL